MQRISITNPQNIIDGTAKKYYFKLRNTGGPKGDKGEKGDTGQTGPQGPKGDAATVAVGSTTTLPVGQDATVENVGSIYNAVLNFGIPQGPQGPQGAKGDKGDTGAQGETGPRGPQGERGTNATVYVGTTTTTNPGTQARVYNSGTDSNAVLNFEIPRGDVGPMPTIAQTTGQAIDQVMSQKATTDALNTKQNTIDSSHKLSADLVTDTATTNKFVTASDKTTWNAKQNALTAGDNITISGDTISATDTTYTAGNNIDITGTTISTQAIAPEVVAELPATGTEGKLYLTPKAHTTSTATGNPITATVAEEAGALESFQLDGDTFQQSYTGKNLYSLQKTQTTTGGITYSIENGVMKVNGTRTAASNLGITFPITYKANTTYTCSVRVVSGSLSFDSKWGSQITFGNVNGNKYVTIYDAYAAASKMATTSFTPTEDTTTELSFWFGYEASWTNKSFDNIVVEIQVEANSTATSFEPYVGGQPSPNPDYPQPIQTVTGEQTITINGTDYPLDLGKNLLSMTDETTTAGTATSTVSSNNHFEISGSVSASWGFQLVPSRKQIAPIQPGTYTLSITNSLQYNTTVQFRNTSSGGSLVGNLSFPSGTTSITFTLNETANYITWWSTASVGTTVTASFDAMLEAGNTATTYAPYKTPIELCKLGTYQDYIWKDGDDWKVHKATGKATFSDLNWQDYQIGSTGHYRVYSSGIVQTVLPPSANNVNFIGYCSIYTNRTSSRTYARDEGCSIQGDGYANTGTIFIYDADYDYSGSATNWKTARGAGQIYFVLKTATDTVITDTALIAQLEAIRTASLENGTNTITNTATGTNLAGDMEIGYYGFASRNRYDKWLWLDINNEYEQIGS